MQASRYMLGRRARDLSTVTESLPALLAPVETRPRNSSMPTSLNFDHNLVTLLEASGPEWEALDTIQCPGMTKHDILSFACIDNRNRSLGARPMQQVLHCHHF